MLATATHDTKLGEDVRARINVLSELPDEWGREVSRWMRINRAHRSIVDGEPAPDRIDEYRFYQVLVGSWHPEVPDPPDASGVHRADQEYMSRRSGSEGPQQLADAEPGLRGRADEFIDGVLGPAGAGKFLPAFLPFQQRIAAFGVTNSLAQVVLKVGSPGVPDFYQGTEMWDLSLVDPDNRRPVDFELRDRLLRQSGRGGSCGDSGTAGPLAGRTDQALCHRGQPAAAARAPGRLRGRRLPAAHDRDHRARGRPRLRAHAPATMRSSSPHRDLLRGIGCDGPPLGADCWKTSRVMLPPVLRDRVFRDIFTGAESGRR